MQATLSFLFTYPYRGRGILAWRRYGPDQLIVPTSVSYCQLEPEILHNYLIDPPQAKLKKVGNRVDNILVSKWQKVFALFNK